LGRFYILKACRDGELPDVRIAGSSCTQSVGPQDGDEALRAAAARTGSRDGLTARFGREEFAWLLSGVTVEWIAKVETLRLRIRHAVIRHIPPSTAS
jgi:GGDEF domain-containing protein